MDTSELKITYQPVEKLKENPRNARTHSPRQIKTIANSIAKLGFNNPVLVDGSNTIVAGHGRVAAAKLLGLRSVPTIRLDHLTPDQLRAYVVTDNRLAELAGWDNAILAIELQHLLTVDGDFDISICGFEIPEIDLILSSDGDKPDADDIFTVASAEQTVTKSGDLWLLGKHKVICGSAIEQKSYVELMPNRKANVVFIDAPYNISIDGNVSGKGAIHHREFVMGSGEMNEPEFIAFLGDSLRLLARYSTCGSVHFLCMDFRHVGELLAAAKPVYDSLLNLCVWVKNCGAMGSFYRSQHELILVFRNGKSQHLNNVQLGRYGRNRTNVWNYPGANTFSKQTDEGNLLALHPTVKPVALIADALLDCSARGHLVLDSFLGSGSTLIAAERTGRVCHGIELDPIYVDTIVKRWQRYTGDHAVHAASGKRFDDIANEQLEVQHG
jgi:DNA modification methylase